jgi:hypothetical protein
MGEIAHDLRSVLDHVVFELAILKNPTIDPTVPSFPIYLYGPRSKIRAKPNQRWRKNTLSYLKPEHRAAIQWLQPYHRRKGGKLCPLWLLHDINNADKHRQIQVVAAAAHYSMLRTTPNVPNFTGRVLSNFRMKTGVHLKNRAKIGHIGRWSPNRVWITMSSHKYDSGMDANP